MNDKERLAYMMKCLEEDFGIKSKEQFYEEFKKMKPIDISVFTAPIKGISKKEIVL